ncbi:hypothetical protein ASC61_01900 [Aeromicrobium sp. Root344]|uniref:hypothetical protein n=1 Tax=Aeromicrobium sp. Root344 TaxID=1736521 RepID=UPI0006F9F28D|nr:hypothetical protein [Aeromicrobium sp. Root344]KQV73862.1 hypothetical protein ASC61_01900 [Aeromicrobium sp. Root344]
MKKSIAGSVGSLAIGAGLALGASLALAAPANAEVNIGWFWNSGDRDVQAKFTAYGEVFSAKEVDGNDYLHWSVTGYGSTTWFVPGNQENVQKDNNQSFAEGRNVSLKACEQWNNLPDDCSSKTGVS